MNYRKLYEDNVGIIPNNWEIHHIDFNHNNNKINNLIAVPSMVHMIIHQSGYQCLHQGEEITAMTLKCGCHIT